MVINQVQINYFFLKYQNNITIFITIQYSDNILKGQKRGGLMTSPPPFNNLG